MPTKDPEKKSEYVRRSNEKKMAQLGNEEYKKYFATNEQKYRVNKIKVIGDDEYKKQQDEYIRQYRAKKKGVNLKARNIATSILNDIFDVVPNMKIVNRELQRNVGDMSNKLLLFFNFL